MTCVFKILTVVFDRCMAIDILYDFTVLMMDVFMASLGYFKASLPLSKSAFFERKIHVNYARKLPPLNMQTF